MQWSLLPYADQGLKTKSSMLQGRFTGDPAFEYEHSVTHRVGEGDSAQEQTTAVYIHFVCCVQYSRRTLSVY